jgi:hypothetical protein
LVAKAVRPTSARQEYNRDDDKLVKASVLVEPSKRQTLTHDARPDSSRVLVLIAAERSKERDDDEDDALRKQGILETNA